MSVGENKAIALRWFDAQSARTKEDFATMDKLTAPDFVYHHPMSPTVRTHEERKQNVVIPLAKAFPDGKYSVDDVVAEGDEVVFRYTIRGTQKGEYMGIPPTNKRIELTSICILRLAEGKVAEMWVENNAMVFMQQLGVIPLPAGYFHVKQ